MLVSAAVLISLFMGLTGISLHQAFKESLLTAEQQRLRTQVYLILGAAELEGENLLIPEFLAEPQFNQLQSGLYAYVRSAEESLWQSYSAQSLSLDIVQGIPFLDQSGQESFSSIGDLQEDYFVYSYQVVWEDGPLEQVFQVSILNDKSSFLTELANYRETLWRWLSVATLMLLILLLLVLRWGLQPLRRVADDLKAIEEGEKEKLSGDYARELKGLTDNLNQLIEHEKHQRERYSNTLGDLAHSLKTPLAVIQGELESIEDNKTVADQVQRMQDIVKHQLSRAVRRQSALGEQSINISDSLDRILSALQKVYANKNINIEKQLDADSRFKGDERDLMEVLGNTLDNAYKYADQHIRISVAKQGKQTRLCIEDDGPGIEEHRKDSILRRGERLDTQQPGQGIGLAVVEDIVSSYSGTLTLGKSELGGLSLEIVF